MDNPVISGLTNKGILEMVSSIAYRRHTSMSLSRFAEKHIQERDLGILKNMNEKKIKDFLISNRPEWTRDYLYEDLNK